MDKRILVMVDMQMEFVDRSHPLVTKFKELLASGAFDVVIATEFIGVPGNPFEKFLHWNGPQHDLIVPDLLPYVDETIQKDTYCHFDALIGTLQAHNTVHRIPEQVYVAGVDTDACVLTTAMCLFDHRIRPIVLADYCWSTGGKEFHEAGLKILRRNIGEDNVIQKERNLLC